MSLDVTVDGADEIAPGLALIKGGGGKLLREKIVASASKRFVIIADESKQVEKLGRFPLPVEVIPMAAPLVSDSLQKLGFTPSIRVNLDGTRYITDEGNLILDCHGLLMENPEEIAAKIDSIVGVVEHRLFLKMADLTLSLTLKTNSFSLSDTLRQALDLTSNFPNVLLEHSGPQTELSTRSPLTLTVAARWRPAVVETLAFAVGPLRSCPSCGTVPPIRNALVRPERFPSLARSL